MTRRNFSAPVVIALAGALLAGCATGRPSRDFTESDFADKTTLLYDIGVAIPADGVILTDAEPRLGGTISASYAFSDYVGAQGMFTFLSAVEEEENAIIQGKFGDFRQDTRVYGLSAGPRFSLPIPLDEDRGGEGPVLEPFIDGGVGVYWTQIIAKFPRGEDGHVNKDVTEDLALNGGGGIIFHLTDALYIGAAVRVHVVFFRFGKDERFLDGNNAADRRIQEAVFFDQIGEEGGRADEHIWLSIGGTVGLRF